MQLNTRFELSNPPNPLFLKGGKGGLNFMKFPRGKGEKLGSLRAH